MPTHISGQPRPILVFEMTWTGTIHAPGNGSTLQTIALAFPDRDIHVFADDSHLTELRRAPTLRDNPLIQFHPVTVSDAFRNRTSVVSMRRLKHEWLTLWHALRQVAPQGPCLIYLLSATSTAIFAASFLARWRGQTSVRIGLHGDLFELDGWRSRNPIARALDLTSALRSHHGGILRFVVLESRILDALQRSRPEAASRTDVLPLPVNMGEVVETQPEWPPVPLRIGFVGQATKAKGIDIFLDIAKDMRQRHGEGISFHVIGRAVPGTDMSIFSPLAEPPTETYLPRAEFVRQLSSMHFVFLPFQPGYYDLATSGALIDAVTWLKPVITLSVDLAVDFFSAAGDIGYLCESLSQMSQTLDALMDAPDEQRYHRQIENLRALRQSRSPDTLASTYRRTIQYHFPEFVT